MAVRVTGAPTAAEPLGLAVSVVPATVAVVATAGCEAGVQVALTLPA